MSFEDFSFEMFKKEIKGFEKLDANEEKELIRLAKIGDKSAMEKLIKANMGYIYKCAIKYSNYGLSLSDLIDEGIVALMQAIKNFDLRKKVRLLTYAHYYVENAMKKFITEQAYSVKITLDYREKLERVIKAIEEFKQREGREPTVEEVSRILNIKPETIRKILNHYRGEFSLDQIDEEEESYTKEETFESEMQEGLEEKLEKEFNLENAVKLVKRALDEREFKVIMEYYGIGCKQKTFEELSKELGISKERIRQLKERAIRKLKFIYGDKFKSLFYD